MVQLLLGLKSVITYNFGGFHHPAHLEFASNRPKSKHTVISMIPHWNPLKLFGCGYKASIMLAKAEKRLTHDGS